MTDNIKLPPFPEGLCLREDIEDYAREAVRLNAQGVPEITTALDGVVSSTELGAVLTYTTSGHSRPCGQIMGANGAGDFALLIYGKPNEAEAAARLHIRELESAGYRIKAATLVTNEECYSGPQIRTLQAPNAKMSLCPECGGKRCPRAKHHDNACAQHQEQPQQERKRRYAQGTALGEFGIIPMCDQVDDEPVKVPSDDLAHEIWAAAQTAPGEGIEDAVERIAALLARRVHHDVPPRDSAKHQEQPQHVEADGTGE